MAQLFTFLSILLLFAVFYPIVCPSSKVLSERRDRAPHIGSSEHSRQYLDDTVELTESRIRKGTSHNKQQSASPLKNPTNNNEKKITESIVDKNIRSVFSTDFGPGLYLFNNTAPFVNQSHYNSYNEQMVGDQPYPFTHPSSSSTNNKEFFKVQRSPNGTLTLVYNEDNAPKVENEKMHSTASTNMGGSNKDNIFQAPIFSAGLPLKKDNLATPVPSATHTPTTNSAIHFPTEEPSIVRQNNDISDCLDNDQVKSDKVLCSRLRNYPEKTHLEELIKKKFSNLEPFFGEDFVLPQNISQRMNNKPEEEFLCRSRVRVIYPQSGMDKDYNWLVVVNVPNYKQGIRVEECLDHGQTCGQHTGLSLPNRFTATCEQHYIYRNLIAYRNDEVVKEAFRIPSCCKCVLRTCE